MPEHSVIERESTGEGDNRKLRSGHKGKSKLRGDNVPKQVTEVKCFQKEGVVDCQNGLEVSRKMWQVLHVLSHEPLLLPH